MSKAFEQDTSDRDNTARWLDFEADGLLAAEDEARLAEALNADPGLARDQAAYRRLHELLTPAPIEVPPDFVARVMDNLPVAEWEQRRASQGAAVWQLPIAAMLVFAVGAAFLLSGIDSALLGTGSAIADFLQTTALAGAGLLEASWLGLGFGLGEMFADSPATVMAFAGVVIGLDILFVSLLMRRKPAVQTAADPESRD